MTGTQAKFFANLEPGYVYPLFKTHKLNVQEVKTIDIDSIQVRMVQSTGNAYLSRITAMLETILKPISVKYCSRTVDEYCKDSPDYLRSLMKWKQDIDGLHPQQDKCEYKIIAADVKSLYPNLQRNLIKSAIKDALKHCSTITTKGQEIILELTLSCLDHTIIQFNNRFYKPSTGIITGENNSVSIANIALHYIIQKIPEINSKCEIFKRFIDDIIIITKDNEDPEFIKEKLVGEFGGFNLHLTFREISTKDEGSQVEFLDVLHYTNKQGKRNFLVKDFVKPTAINATFLNGKSFHPVHIFKGIILGEGKRLRRLNETEEGFQNSIERLKSKCHKSGFSAKIVHKMIKKVKDLKNIWNNGNIELQDQNNNNTGKNNYKTKKIPWATSFGDILKPNKKEKDLLPDAVTTYRRPPTLGNMLTKYKTIAMKNDRTNTIQYKGSSKGCKRCGLCGHYANLENMVKDSEEIKTKYGQSIKIRQNLNCKDYGIYAAECKMCSEYYVGQTINPFHERWNGHRKTWKKMINGTTSNDKEDNNKKEKYNDEQALCNHYEKYHQEKLRKNNFKLSDAFYVYFVEKPPKEKLDIAENFWISRLKATINIAGTCLPRYK